MKRNDKGRQRARELRALGRTYKQIAEAVGVSVKSAHEWSKDVVLSPEQIAANRTGGPPTGTQPDTQAIEKRAAAWRASRRELRRAWQEQGREAARSGDWLHRAGCMLYWGEGGKRRNGVVFTNSDVNMLRFFRRFLVESLGVDPGRLRIRVNVHLTNGLSLDEVEAFWLEQLELCASCLRRGSVDPRASSGSGGKPGRLPYGTLDLRVSCTRTVQHVLGAIQGYAGIERPEWLDGSVTSSSVA